MMQSYFFGPTAMDSPFVNGFYVSRRRRRMRVWGGMPASSPCCPPLVSLQVDDGWSASGPSEMAPNATEAMGMSTADITAM